MFQEFLIDCNDRDEEEEEEVVAVAVAVAAATTKRVPMITLIL